MCYPDLAITYDTMESEVIFNYHDNSNEQKQHKVPVTVENSSCTDITLPEFADGGPCWQENAAFTYTFVGWSEKEQILVSPESPNLEDDAIYETDDKLAELFPDTINDSSLTNINGNRLLYPVFKANRKEYPVNFYIETETGGRRLLYSTVVYYGAEAVYAGTEKLDDLADETKPEPERYTYSFADWYPSPSCITGNTNCVARFSADEIQANEIEYELYTDGANTKLSIVNYLNKNNKTERIPNEMTVTEGTFPVCRVGGFSNYDTLEYIVLPDSLKEFNQEAFKDCKNLKQVIIPPNVTEIANKAFSSCDNLTKVTLPTSLTTLGPTCFAWCSDLNEVNLEELTALKYIKTYVFDGCALTGVTIPSTVTEINDHAFGSMESLQTVTFMGTDPSKITIHQEAFKYSDTEANPITFNLPWSEEQHNEALQCDTFKFNVEHAILNFNYTGGNS